MGVARICWYLCGLFALAVFLESTVTYHPQSQRTMWLLMGGTATLSLVFGVLAVVLWRIAFREPRWLVRVFQALAVLATVLVILMVGG